MQIFEQSQVSTDETTLFCIHNDDVKIICLDSGTTIAQLSQTNNEDEPVSEVISCFCIHPSKPEVVVATQNSLLRHWRFGSNHVLTGEIDEQVTAVDDKGLDQYQGEKECIRSIRGHNMPVLCMCFDATGTLVATGSADRTIRVWDISKGFCTHIFRDHTDIIQKITFHPDPQRLLLISCSDDKTVRVFDLRDQCCVAVFKDHLASPTDVAFSCSGYLMASCGRDKVRILYFTVSCFTEVSLLFSCLYTYGLVKI